jgi:biotin carboxyl carrier protein
MKHFLFSLAMLFLTIAGCAESHSPKSSKSPPPAKVEKLPLETEIARVTLTPDADRRLGITTAQVIDQDVSRRRTFGGDVIVPVGKSIIVAAPFPGTIVPPEKRPIPTPGQRVASGESVLSIAPLLTPERDVPTPAEQVQMTNARATILSALTVAEGDVERAKAESEAAKISLDRASKLLSDRVGSARFVDDAQAQLNIAATNFVAAQQRVTQLRQLAKSLDSQGSSGGNADPLIVSAPQAGVVRSLSVTPGQTVTIGAPLFEVVDTDTVWIRVPIYVDLLNTIVTDSAAEIVGLDGRHNPEPRIAHPIAAPPSADPLNTTADLYYSLENRDGSLRPGQRVGIELT